MDGRTANAEMLGGFGDGVLFSLHAIALYHNSSRGEQHTLRCHGTWGETRQPRRVIRHRFPHLQPDNQQCERVNDAIGFLLDLDILLNPHVEVMTTYLSTR